MVRDKKNSGKKIQSDDTKLDAQMSINQLQQYLERYELDDVDLQLLSEFQEAKPVSQLKGTYTISKRQLYRRAKKLDQKGLTKYIRDGKTKHYFATKQGQKIIDICFSGSEESADSVRNSSRSGDSLKKIVRTHAYSAEMPIHTKPKNLDTLLKQGSRTTGLRAHNMQHWTKYYGWMRFEAFEAYVEITTQNVFVRIKDILATSAKEAAAEAARIIEVVKAELEETFSTSTKAFRLGKYELKVSSVINSKHHAILLHPLAQKCKKHGYSIQGTTWSVDASKGIPEAEATDPRHATEDCDYELKDLEARTRAQVGVMDLKALIEDMSKILDKLIEHSKEITARVQSNTDSNGNFNQLLLQQQQFFTQLIMQQNQQIMTALSAFQRHLEQSKGGVN